MCNRELSVLISMPFDAEPRLEESVIALDKDAFLPAASRKVQKIGKN